MEKRLNKKIETYISGFKADIKQQAASLGLIGDEKSGQLLEYICDYNRLILVKEDFVKRKRVKNVVPHVDRCCAKRATEEQCTRRKKSGYEFCGTHVKCTPHGIYNDCDDNESIQDTKTIEVWAQDIKGIIYYIDKNTNVYKAEDVVGNKLNPQIIAAYEFKDGVYSIPAFNI
jgi:hypothetical protein